MDWQIARFGLLGLLVVTGAAGLSAEVVLGRSLALLLGSSGSAQAVTLAAFLGGMAVGASSVALVSKRLLDGLRQPLLAWAVAEAMVGLWLLLLPDAQTALDAWLRAAEVGGDPGSPLAVTVKLAVAAALVLPLSVPMGATLPLIACALERMRPAEATAWVSQSYAFNALGGALGAGLASFVAIEALGLDLPLLIAGAADLAIALVAALAARALPATIAPQKPLAMPPATLVTHPMGQGSDVCEGPQRSEAMPGWTLVAAAGLTGLLMLALEIVWTRLTGLLLGANVYAFGLMLVLVILGIALGSGAAERLLARGLDPRRLFALCELGASVSILWLLSRLPVLPEILLWQRSRLASWPENSALWNTVAGGHLALHLLPTAALLGAAFPTLLACASRGESGTGRATARLLGANTTGNLVGAMATGFLVMPSLGVEGALALCATLALLLGALFAGKDRPLQAVALPIAAWLVALGAMGLPSTQLLYVGLFREHPADAAGAAQTVAQARVPQTALRRDGKDSSVSVHRYPNGSMVFRVGGKPDGSTTDAVSQGMLGHLGPTLLPNVRRSLVIGLGTGQTAAALASHPEVEVEVAEISPAMADVAALFAEHNGDVLRHPRVRVHYVDGRDLLAAQAPGRLDLIVSEPSNPWVVGVADLYTVEHFVRVRAALRPGGRLVQWMHGYEIGDALLREVLCTLQLVFDDVLVFRMAPGDLALVAGSTPLDFDAAGAAARFAAPSVQAELDRHPRSALPRTLDEVLLTQLCGPVTVRAYCADFNAPLRERHPRVEYQAPRDFFAGRSAAETWRRLDRRLTPGADTLLAHHLASGDKDAPPTAALPAAATATIAEARRDAFERFLARANDPFEGTLQVAMTAFSRLPVAAQLTVAGLPAQERVTDFSAAVGHCEALERHRLLGFGGPLPRLDLPPQLMAWRKRCRDIQRGRERAAADAPLTNPALGAPRSPTATTPR